jgi:hypothetical protein
MVERDSTRHEGARGGGTFPQDRDDVESLFREAARIYIETRRTRIPYFVRRHFGFRGSVRIHRVAFGWDIARAPVNLALALPHLLKLLAAAALRAAGARRAATLLVGVPTQLRTAVEREIEWLVRVEFLELPFAQEGRRSDRDALAEILVSRLEVVRALEALGVRRPGDGGGRVVDLRLSQNVARYAGARNAAAEIATSLASAGAGGLLVQQLTPSALSLGPAVAVLVAQHTAIAAFPLGAGAGAVWYALFPASPSEALIAATTAALLAASSVFAAFAGILADPVQRALGIHRKRLESFVDALAGDLEGGTAGAFQVRAHYLARLFDVFEAARLAVRSAI